MQKMTREQAVRAASDELRVQAWRIRAEDAYAAHVTEEEKDRQLGERLRYAEEVRAGRHHDNLSVAQKIYWFETGESVAILPSYDKTR